MSLKKTLVSLIGGLGIGTSLSASTPEPLPMESKPENILTSLICGLFSCEDEEMVDGLEGIDQIRLPGDDHNPTTICT